MLYGQTMRLPGEYFDTTSAEISPHEFIQNFRKQMQTLQPTQTAHHDKQQVFTHPALGTCSHVFVRIDAVKRPFIQPYEGPYKVEKRSAKFFKVNINEKHINITIDRLKPAFIISDPQIIETEKPTIFTTRSGRRVTPPVRFS